jgi:hypothetical protein
MPIGTCDPASRGAAFNEMALSQGEGKVTIDIRYGWDGVSTKETGCEGPLVNGTGPAANRWAVRVTNSDTQSWYVHTLGKRGQPRDYEFAAGTVTTFTANQASNNGFATISDFEELLLTTSPTRTLKAN